MSNEAAARETYEGREPKVWPRAPRRPGLGTQSPGGGTWTGKEVPLRDLRNPGRVVEALVRSGEIARVTRNGELVAWLVPATAAERRRAELIAQGKLRPGRVGGLAGRGRMPRQEAGRPLSDALSRMRAAEGR